SRNCSRATPKSLRASILRAKSGSDLFPNGTERHPVPFTQVQGEVQIRGAWQEKARAAELRLSFPENFRRSLPLDQQEYRFGTVYWFGTPAGRFSVDSWRSGPTPHLSGDALEE